MSTVQLLMTFHIPPNLYNAAPLKWSDVLVFPLVAVCLAGPVGHGAVMIRSLKHQVPPARYTALPIKNQQCRKKCNRNISSIQNDGKIENHSGLDIIRRFRFDHPKNFILSHYNVNSIRWKFVEVREILDHELVDFLGISETKLSPSFINEFNVSNYCKPYRQDRNDRGGGVMVFIKDNLPHRLLSEYSGCHEGIDFLSFELMLKSRKWYITYFYRPPAVNEGIFTRFLSGICNIFISKGDAYIAACDCNINFCLQTL